VHRGNMHKMRGMERLPLDKDELLIMCNAAANTVHERATSMTTYFSRSDPVTGATVAVLYTGGPGCGKTVRLLSCARGFPPMGNFVKFVRKRLLRIVVYMTVEQICPAPRPPGTSTEQVVTRQVFRGTGNRGATEEDEKKYDTALKHRLVELVKQHLQADKSPIDADDSTCVDLMVAIDDVGAHPDIFYALFGTESWTIRDSLATMVKVQLKVCEVRCRTVCGGTGFSVGPEPMRGSLPRETLVITLSGQQHGAQPAE
jgi:hypothetical protein